MEVFPIGCRNFVAHEIVSVDVVEFKVKKHVSVCICKVNSGGDICVRGSVGFGNTTR